MEAQLLSLEWEINPEKLHKTREEVGALRELLKQRKDIGSILGFMGSVLDRMIADEESIDPASIKFLLDAKETIKLSFEREDEREFEIYKSLAREGIEARFRGLAGAKKPLGELASPSAVESRPEKAPAERTPEEKHRRNGKGWKSFSASGITLSRRRRAFFRELTSAFPSSRREVTRPRSVPRERLCPRWMSPYSNRTGSSTAWKAKRS